MKIQSLRWWAALFLPLMSLHAYGAGTFSFQPSAVYATGISYPAAMAAADFNGDGYPDIAVIDQYSNTGGILIGNGDGTLKAPHTFSVDGSSHGYHTLASADFDGDGKQDIVVANVDTNTLSVLFGKGDGTFSPATRIDGCNGCALVTTADVNGDNTPDIVEVSPGLANLTNGTMNVFLANGDGTFQAPVSITLSTTGATDIGVGDFNGDHLPDIVVSGAHKIETLLGTGHATFQGVTTQSSTPINNAILAIGHLDKDGNLDVILNDMTVAYVFLGQGDGTFKRSSATFDVGLGPAALGLADFNGDGNPDILAINEGEFSSSMTSSIVSILAGKGDGTFQPRQLIDMPLGGLLAGISPDMNKDGIPDIVAASAVGPAGKIDVRLNSGTSPSNPPPTTNPPRTTNPPPSSSKSNPASGSSGSTTTGGGGSGGGAASPELLVALGLLCVRRRFCRRQLR